ncbi:MAG: sulfite exporter TauE/SafE family protein [Cyanobacteriota bacterium]
MFSLTLASVSSLSWFVSTLAGGGTPLILIPMISYFLGGAAVPPVVTIGMLMGNSQRVWLYWEAIDWQIMRWYLPGAIVGSVLGAFIFTQTQVEWLPLLLGLFLLLSTLSDRLGQDKPSFRVKAWYFLPGGFIFAFLSGLIGSAGPLLNPLYLNYGLVKEDMIATKSATGILVHVAKLIAYGIFGVLTLPMIGYGVMIGVAAFPGNWLGQIFLKTMSEQRFRQLVTLFVAFSGMLILWEQRQVLIFW